MAEYNSSPSEIELTYRDRVAGRIICVDPPVLVGDVSVKDNVLLLAIIRAYTSEDMRFIGPLSGFTTTKGFPRQEMCNDVIAILRGRNLLSFDEDSVNPEAYLLEEGSSDADGFRYYPMEVTYRPNVETGDRVYDLLDTIQMSRHLEEWAGTNDWEDDIDGIISIWKQLALEECLEYLCYTLKERGFELSPGPKTIQALEQALASCSVSVVFSFIGAAASRVSDFYLKEKVPKKQAVNIIPNRLLSYLERQQAGQWSGSGYRRDFNCPRSVMSEVLFDKVLKIGDLGFTLPYGEYYPRIKDESPYV